ncbi:MAG: hypothetical protein F6K35_01110 [Okeania sp. SIO2H7]|nr:hypothetical protein [Okeania sp. SIO2H7]
MGGEEVKFISPYEEIQTYKKNLGEFGENLIESGFFNNLASEHLMSEVDYNIDDYLALLDSLSPYIALERNKRDSLFASLRKTLEKSCQNSIPTSYLSMFHVAKKMK